MLNASTISNKVWVVTIRSGDATVQNTIFDVDNSITEELLKEKYYESFSRTSHIGKTKEELLELGFELISIERGKRIDEE